MVENLLSVTRMTGEQTKIKKEMEAGEEVLSAAAMKIKKHYPEITVSVRAPQELLMIPMDVILIEQVLINLMENSIQHGGTTTRVELQLRKRRGRMRALRGCGQRTRASRGRSSRSSSRATVSSRLRNVTADGRAQYGHRAFGLHEHCAGARRHDGRRKTGKSAAPYSALHCHWRNEIMKIREKILVIEDEQTIAQFYAARSSTANDYDVLLVAHSGAMGESMIASHCPDVIILDLGLPDVDGMEILRKVHARWSKVPIRGGLRADATSATRSKLWTRARTTI